MNKTASDSVLSMPDPAEHALTIGTTTYTMPRFASSVNACRGNVQSAEDMETSDGLH